MRIPTEDENAFLATIAAAAEAGITVFDTARAYGEGERLLGRALRDRAGARIVTKGGMSRAGGAWVPDGRAKAIRADCEASLAALGGMPIDIYLVHAPDPRTPWSTTVRALARLVDEGLVRRVGVSNVSRPQLDEALELAPISAVQVALSPYDLGALRGGVVDRCAERGVAVIAHSPLGGPRRVERLGRNEHLVRVADALGATRWEVALAWLLGLSPALIPIPGARRPETARSAARAASLDLDEATRAELDRAFGARRPARRRRRPVEDAEVVLVMGIPGAGKTRLAEEYVARGYVRLNRDERGGSLRELATALDDALADGARRVVLDNTYLTRASRSYVLDAAGRHGVPVRCVWLDTPLAQAQVNLVERLLDRFQSLPSPDELREAAKREPGVHAPTSQMRTVRELEPPEADEGFAAVKRLPFVRRSDGGRPGVLVAAPAVEQPGWKDAVAAGREAPHLLFDWRPDGLPDDLAGAAAQLSAEVAGPVDSAVCPHGGGPPACWCRPPLPGLALAFARKHGVDPAQSTLVGCRPAHRTLATTLGARYVAA
jgi:aryl-alcohol dehydrogenase-like predicted oxidoreductase/predicted kinase